MTPTDVSPEDFSLAFLLGLFSLAPAYGQNERVPALLEQLTSGDAQNRSQAAYELGKLEPKDQRAVLPLIERLTDDSYLVRANAAAALAGFQSAAKAAGQRLAAALLDQYAVVRDHAVIALNSIRPDAKFVLPYLSKVLENKSVTQASQLAELLLHYAKEVTTLDKRILPQWTALCDKVRNYPHPAIQKVLPAIRKPLAYLKQEDLKEQMP
jgi:HEAT repeat protein